MTGRDGIHPDPEAAELDRPGAGQGLDRGLRRAVGGGAGNAALCGDRRDVDDAAAAPGRHLLRERRGEEERSLHIRLEELLERVQALLDRGSERERSGVVHQDVHVIRLLDKPAHRLRIPQVGLAETCPPAVLPEQGRSLDAGFLTPAGDHDLGSLAGEQPCGREADAGCAPVTSAFRSRNSMILPFPSVTSGDIG